MRVKTTRPIYSFLPEPGYLSKKGFPDELALGLMAVSEISGSPAKNFRQKFERWCSLKVETSIKPIPSVVHHD
jgi:hypothetical protein